MKIVLWIIAAFLFCFVMFIARNADVERCEVDTARKLNTEAHWVNGKCMIKGYGRFN